MNKRKSNLIENVEDNISKEILNWSFGNERFLNIIAPPYSSIKTLLTTLRTYLSKGNRVLYVTNEKINEIQIEEELKRLGFKNYTYVKNPDSNYKDSLLVLCSFEGMYMIKGEFKVVIIDDSRDFPEYKSEGIIDLISNNYFSEAKYISFSLESIFEGFKEIIIPVRENKLPIVEPRFLNTRIDLSKEIPFVAYEYIKWSLKAGRNIIIYVPDKHSVKQVFTYLSSFKDEVNKHIMYFLKESLDERAIQNYSRSKEAILITNDFKKAYSSVRESDIMVFFADNSQYNYKSLVHFCGKVGRGESLKRAEVIFLSNSISEDMETAKSITRSFNKEAWEMNLFQY
ncbi:MAG: hypothetical protein H7Y18_01470 [Clostridiaceae bacterium]|nr:hypothetical protein [Clostridiaceae bacterium]